MFGIKGSAMNKHLVLAKFLLLNEGKNSLVMLWTQATTFFCNKCDLYFEYNMD